jgi:hypothetical protein
MLKDRRFLLIFLSLVLLGIVAFFATRISFESLENLGELDSRLARLRTEVAEANDVAAADPNYQPQVPGNILALFAPAADILRQLPGVAAVQVKIPVARPKHRIVHITDYRLLPADRFLEEQEEQAGRTFAQWERDRRLKIFEREIELVQLEQLIVLKCLAKRHGLKEIWAKGTAGDERHTYRARVRATRTLEKSIHDYREMLKLANKEPDAAEARKLKQDLETVGRRWLELGAAGRLLASGAIQEVWPLDPRMAPDHPEMLPKTILDNGRPVAVIVWDGAQNLTATVRSSGRTDIEYLRIVTGRYQEFVGK